MASAWEIYINTVAALGGPAIIAGGLLAWLGRARLQTLKSDLDQNLKTHEANLKREGYVTQRQYDLELRAYEEIWASLVDRVNASTRLAGEVADLDDSDIDKVNAIFAEYFEWAREYQNLVSKHRIFIPHDVWETCMRFQDVTTSYTARIVDELSGGRRDDFPAGPVAEQVNLVSTTIKKRLASLRVVRG